MSVLKLSSSPKMANQLMDQNRFSASMLWPGSQVHYNNQTIRYLQEFDEKNPNPDWNKRIDKIIEWMSDNPEEANCVFAYFDEPDFQAHKFGPFSHQVLAEVKRADNIIGYLLDKLRQKKLLERTNLIILSDHGMSEIRLTLRFMINV